MLMATQCIAHAHTSQLDTALARELLVLVLLTLPAAAGV